MRLAEVGLYLRIQGDVTGVVEEQVELDFVVAGARQQGRVEGIGLRRNACFVRDAVHILPFHGLRRQELAQGGAVGLALCGNRMKVAAFRARQRA
jgi:hypothetical protein